jgi:hypothetical protein
VRVAGDRTVEFEVPGQSLVLLPGEEIDYTGILLQELGLDSLTADME